jgi:hypothetical protein
MVLREMTLNKLFTLHPSRALKPLKKGEIERQLETMVPQGASNHDGQAVSPE